MRASPSFPVVTGRAGSAGLAALVEQPGQVAVTVAVGQDVKADFGDWNGLKVWLPLVLAAASLP